MEDANLVRKTAALLRAKEGPGAHDVARRRVKAAQAEDNADGQRLWLAVAEAIEEQTKEEINHARNG